MNQLLTPAARRSWPRTLWRSALATGLGLAFSGCNSLPQLPQQVSVDFPVPPEARPIAVFPGSERSATGSLYTKVAYRPAFEDRRARAVGDTVTILIVEQVTASQVSSSTANRSTSGSAGISAFPIFPAAELAKLSIGTKSENDFSGKGGTQSANTFTGSITTTVMEVLPNGHLLVTGDKQIGVNQNVDVLRFSGTVDPRLVQAGSIVNSTQVANVRIESRGRGAQAEAQTTGWLSRFFFSLLPS